VSDIYDLEILLRARQQGMGVLKDTESGLGGIAKAGALVGVVLAGATVAALAECVKVANQFQGVQVQLNNALKDAGEKVTPKMTSQLDALEAKMRAFGHTDTDTVAVMTQLTQGGLSWSQAMSAMGPITDLAAAKHIDLATAAKDVLLATQGSSKALKELGVTLPPTIPTANQLASAIAAVSKQEQLVASTHGPAHVKALQALEAAQAKVALITEEQKNRTGGLSQVLDALSGKLGGSASAQAGTFGGHLAAMRAEIDHAAVQVGTVLIPVLDRLLAYIAPIVPVVADWATSMLTQLIPAVSQFAGWLTTLGPELKKGYDIFKVLAPFIAGIAAAWVLWNVALGITAVVQGVIAGAQFVLGLIQIVRTVGLATSAQWLWNVAMTANPIGLVVIAIAALAAGFIWAYNNVKPFRDFINGLWSDLKNFGGYLSGHFAGILGAVGKLLGDIASGNIGSVLGDVSAVKNAFEFGGLVPGPQGQPVLTVLHGGEMVTRAGRVNAGGAGGDMSETNRLLREQNALLRQLASPPSGQSGVAAALYKAVQGAGLNRMRGMAGTA
jgi:phage-related minor tail protein